MIQMMHACVYGSANMSLWNEQHKGTFVLNNVMRMDDDHNKQYNSQ